jgi:hypothetical protein
MAGEHKRFSVSTIVNTIHEFYSEAVITLNGRVDSGSKGVPHWKEVEAAVKEVCGNENIKHIEMDCEKLNYRGGDGPIWSMLAAFRKNISVTVRTNDQNCKWFTSVYDQFKENTRIMLHSKYIKRESMLFPLITETSSGKEEKRFWMEWQDDGWNWRLYVELESEKAELGKKFDKSDIQVKNIGSPFNTLYYRVHLCGKVGLYVLSYIEKVQGWILDPVYNSIEVDHIYGEEIHYNDSLFHSVKVDGKIGILQETSWIRKPVYDSIEKRGFDDEVCLKKEEVEEIIHLLTSCRFA